jgi:spore maturation protein CgeB
MKVVLFCHSLISDWNNGNAHFLRGIASELLARRHQVVVYEPANSWSLQHLVADAEPGVVERYHQAFPLLTPEQVDVDRLDLDRSLDGADLVLVHEWSAHSLVKRIGQHKAAGGRYLLLFHDTHHRSVSDVTTMSGYDLEHYDGVLAFGEVIRQRYLERGWGRRAWTWHEAADTRVFHPRPAPSDRGDLVWIGNWGDDERSAELRSYLIEPAAELGLKTTVYGVRYPDAARQELAAAGIRYGGWLANYDAPSEYARHRMTIHVPRRPYVAALSGIPTIRIFEALACGIPLISVAWQDVEGLFEPGKDFLVVQTPQEMRRQLRALTHDEALRASLVEHGLATIHSRHTCAHRVDELLALVSEARGGDRTLVNA